MSICLLKRHWYPVQTAAGVWPGCRFETNPFCWARQSVVVGRQHSSWIGFSVAADINSNLVDLYFLVWSLSRLLCCVGSGSHVATRVQHSDRPTLGCIQPPNQQGLNSRCIPFSYWRS